MLKPSGKVTPFLWFESQAEEAANFYVSLFPDSKLLDVSRWSEGAPVPAGTVMSATFRLDGREIIAFNGGPYVKLNEAMSMFVNCKDQAEVDHYWQALLADGGTPSRCGWLKDRFGLSWQIVPEALGRLLGDPDPARAARAMKAMMGMVKLDIAAMENAAAGIEP